MGRCIMYTGIRLLLLICPFIFSFFILSNFQTLKFFVTLFSGTVRPRKLKLDTHVDNGLMYRVYLNHAVPAYSSHYFFIFLSLQFSNIKKFHHTFLMPTCRRLKLSTHMDNGQMYHVYRKQAAAAFVPRGQWADVSFILESCRDDASCIPESGCSCLFIPLFPYFSFSPIFKH